MGFEFLPGESGGFQLSHFAYHGGVPDVDTFPQNETNCVDQLIKFISESEYISHLTSADD